MSCLSKSQNLHVYRLTLTEVATESSSLSPVSKHTKTAASGDRTSEAIVVLTSATSALLQYKTASKGFLGDHLVSINYVFLICVMFAFSSAFSAIFLLQTKPKAASVLKISAIMCFSSAAFLVFSAIFNNVVYY